VLLHLDVREQGPHVRRADEQVAVEDRHQLVAPRRDQVEALFEDVDVHGAIVSFSAVRAVQVR